MENTLIIKDRKSKDKKSQVKKHKKETTGKLELKSI
jgi:hypothetical protein